MDYNDEELCLELAALESYKCTVKGLTISEKGTLVKKSDVKKMLISFIKWNKPSLEPKYAGQCIVKLVDGTDHIAYYLNSPFRDEETGRYKCEYYSKNRASSVYLIYGIKAWRRLE